MPDLPCRGGGGVNPTSMAQNDTHVALIILTTQMWVGGGGIIGGKNFFGPKFVFPCLWRQHPFLHKTKGPTRNPISPPPPPFGGRPCHPPRRAIFRSPYVSNSLVHATRHGHGHGHLQLLGEGGRGLHWVWIPASPNSPCKRCLGKEAHSVMTLCHHHLGRWFAIGFTFRHGSGG